MSELNLIEQGLALKIPCPQCGVAANESCKGIFASIVHPARVEAVHVRQEIRDLIRRGNVTPAEVAELRCNSWEWQALVPAMNDEAFVAKFEHALANCFTKQERPFTTYNQAVEGLYAPELLKRFKSAIREAQTYAEVIDNVRAALGQDSTHYLVIADDVKDLVDAVEADTVAHLEFARKRALGELAYPIEKCESTQVLSRLREHNEHDESLASPGNKVFVTGWGPAHLTTKEPKASIGVRGPFVTVEFDDGGVFSVSRELLRVRT